MKLKVNVALVLFASTFALLPINRGVIMENHPQIKEQVINNNESFDFYSSSTYQFGFENGVLTSHSSAEQKAILKDFSSATVDAKFTISAPSIDSPVNGGLYVHAKEAGNDVDQIDAFNIQIEKGSGSNHYRVNLFEFTNSAYIGCIANTVDLFIKKASLDVRVTVDETDINVYLNNSDVPSLNKKIKSYAKDGLSVGFRSMFANQTFSNIDISSQIETKEVPTVKVLMVGNSYAQDTMTYAHEIAASQGVNMVCGVIYYGGCTVQQHATFIENKSPVYIYFKNGGTDKMNATFDDILFDEDWDYISIQTGTGNQGLKDTYYPYIQKIISYLEFNRPRAEVGLFQSWQVPSCFEGTGNSRLSKYGDSTENMYHAIINATHEIVEETGLEFLVGSSEIMHRINETAICDDSVLEKSFNRDSTGHLNERGRYLMGMLMYKTITGMNVGSVNYLPYGHTYGDIAGPSEAEIEVMKDVVEGMFDEYKSMNHLVDPKAIVGIEVENYKKNYVVDEYFDYENMKVNVVYGDGRKIETKNYSINIMRPLKLTDSVLIVSYHGLKLRLEIEVSRN